jgi:2-polyprenyl-6-hydroxyphenyl methylase/3-demethylubiquinone-9 3-methyltransferase
MRFRWKIAQAAELKWWENYLQNKEPKAYLEWKSTYWGDFLKKCNVVIPDGLNCLDAGCGPAGIFIILDKQKTDALDPLLEQYETKLSIFKKVHYPTVNFISSTIESLDSNTPYDLIFCLNAINHVSDWKKSIGNLMAHLKPGGKMILSTDIHRYTFLKPIFRLLPGDILHPQQHSLQDYMAVLNGYEPESLEKVLIKREAIFDYYAFIIKKK